jgi:hypothetical protein
MIAQKNQGMEEILFIFYFGLHLICLLIRKTEPESDVEGQGTSPSNSIHEFVVPDDAPIEYDSGYLCV